MINIVSEYNNYLKTLPQLISNTYYKAEYFVKALGISQPTYYRKLRDNTFSPKEVTILTKLLFPKEAYKEELLASIEQGRADFKSGNTVSSEDVRKEMRKKIESYQ